MGVLDGIRVLSFTTGIAGPRAGRILRQLGAEIIKIESRNGGIDAFRYFRKANADGDVEFRFDESTRYIEVNLGVRSVTIDLKHPQGLQLARELVAISDVVLDNYRPGVLDRIGLGQDVLVEANPQIITVRAPGLGSDGPRAQLGTWGPSLMAFSGLTYLWNHPGKPDPAGSQSVYPDYFVSSLLPGIIMAALVRRKKTKEPLLVDVAQADAMAYVLGISYIQAAWTGADPEPQGNARDGMAPYGVYACDGTETWCAIAVETDDQWVRLCDVMDMPALGQDPAYSTAEGRTRHREAIDAFVGAWTAEYEAQTVMHRLQAAGVPAGTVLSNEDLAADPHVAARGFVKEVDQPGVGAMAVADIPLRAWPDAIEQPQPAPALGEANAYVVRDLLGRSAEDYQQLTEQRVMY